MSRETPKVPTMFPLASRRGILVVETQVTWPSGQISFSSLPTSGLARPDYFLLITVGLLGVFCGEEVEVGLADRLGRVVQPKLFSVRLIDPGKAALPILEVDHVGEVVHEGVEEMPVPQSAPLRPACAR